MKALVHPINTNPKYAKVFHWGKLITVTGGAQVIVQAIGLISGILIIRLLPTAQYALYTLANTMLGTMVLLADGGITAAVMSQGGKVWQDRKKLGIVFLTGLDLRKKFAVGSLLVAAPVLLYLLRYHGASWLVSLIVFFSLIPAFLATLSSQLLEIIPKLQQDITPLQKIQVGVNTGRLALICLSLFAFPLAFVATLATGFPQLLGNRYLFKLSGKYADKAEKIDPAVQQEIISFVKRLLPGVIYYCVSGQITVWLISIFGSTANVAQVGALGRLVVLLSIVNVLFTTLVSPRFARMPNVSGLLLKRYVRIQICLFALSACIVGTAWLFSREILWVLGPQYSNLGNEIVLIMVGGCLGLIAGVSFNLYISRGWSIKPIISIPIEIVSIACSILLFNISSIKGILSLNIFIAIVQVIMHNTYCLIKIKSLDK